MIIFATWHTFGSHMAHMWPPRQLLTDQWMKNVTEVLYWNKIVYEVWKWNVLKILYVVVIDLKHEGLLCNLPIFKTRYYLLNIQSKISLP